MAEPLLVVRLDVQQWNIVLAGLGELPLKISSTVFAAMMEQLNGQTPKTNGVDLNPPKYPEVKHDAV